MIERLRVLIPAGVVGEYSSPELAVCTDSYLVSVPLCVTKVACKRPQPFCQKCRCQVTPKHACVLDPTKLELVDCAVHYPGIVWEPNQGNELTCNSSGNTQPQSPQLAELAFSQTP